MLEVLFSDSAAGSMAVGIGRKGYAGGAVSVLSARAEDPFTAAFCAKSESISFSAAGSREGEFL